MKKGRERASIFFFMNFLYLMIFYYFCRPITSVVSLSDGVTGNTSDFGSEESRFEP